VKYLLSKHDHNLSIFLIQEKKTKLYFNPKLNTRISVDSLSRAS